jgi:hypothetical protein
MEPAIHEHHLVKYPGQLQRDLIPINIMFRQIRQVIHLGLQQFMFINCFNRFIGFTIYVYLQLTK